MQDILKCVPVFIGYIFVFNILGVYVTNRLHWNVSQVESIIFGFFVYYIFFQFVYLPFMFCKGSFHVLGITWSVVLLCILVFCLIGICRNHYRVIDTSILKLDGKTKLWIVCLGVVLVAEMGFIVLQKICGWDTGYYVGVMNEALKTDTMYFYNGNTGRMEGIVPLRYALSGFYMQFAWISSLLHVKPITVAYFLIRMICYFLAASVVYLIGMEIFHKNHLKAIFMTVVWGLINIFWYTNHATSFFLIKRSYEAKGFCANVILPMLLYCCLCVIRNREDIRKNWQRIFVLSLASVSVSMSALVTVPVMIGTLMLTLLITEKNKKVILYGVLCILPNVIYLAVYLLSILNILVLEV